MSLRRIPSLAITATLVLGGACDEGSSGSEGSSPSSGSKAEKETEQRAAKEKVASRDTFEAPLDEMTDQEYPDNPNIGHRSELHGSADYETFRLERREGYRFDLRLVPEDDSTPAITVKNVDISVYTPRAPQWIRESDYMTYIGLINQEWNRQQIRYPKRFEVGSDEPEWDAVTRVDIARNCLNAKLWEVILYAEEDGQAKPFYHGWFDFPEPLYAKMFEDENGIPYDEYEKPLENWVDPDNEPVDLSVLRTKLEETNVDFTSHNDEFYELTGARKKKYENIIEPDKPETIQAMLDDSTRYATFDQPGFYNTEKPRKTKLGRLAKPQEVTLRRVDPVPVQPPRYELDIRFEGDEGKRTTRLVVGGLAWDDIPRLKEEHHNQGYKMPMGIANHSFYETYEQATNGSVSDNPYYGMLFDGEGNWIDSHHVGIDGPLMHWDAKQDNRLHFYILSFERHAFVGHYEITIPDEMRGA